MVSALGVHTEWSVFLGVQQVLLSPCGPGSILGSVVVVVFSFFISVHGGVSPH